MPALSRMLFLSLVLTLKVVKKASSIRLWEEDGALVFLHVCCHGDRMVCELVVPGLCWPNSQCLGSRPVLPINDWCQQPLRVGLVGNGQVTGFLATHSGSEMKNLHNITSQ